MMKKKRGRKRKKEKQEIIIIQKLRIDCDCKNFIILKVLGIYIYRKLTFKMWSTSEAFSVTE